MALMHLLPKFVANTKLPLSSVDLFIHLLQHFSLCDKALFYGDCVC